MSKVAMIGLGCPKNQVDGEMLLSALVNEGFEITAELESADVVIVNTCGFIDDAKKEAIDNILYVADLKNEGIIKGLVVTGCLAERYQSEISTEIPEVDAVVGIGANGDIAKICKDVLKGNKVNTFPSKYCLSLEGDRILTTPSHYAYLKIAEGCSNCCTYCAIPSIRGKFRSREMENIISEAEKLAKEGIKELIVVAQDTTRYGIDLYGEYKLASLLKELCRIDGIEWIRILYCYPECITDELIEVMASEEKICNYIDLPLQHADGDVLKRMNRTGDEKSLTELINKIRAKIPDIVIRTTFITGFPGETEDNFETLSRFVNNVKFDRLGCFAYSPEEGTFAAKMENQIDDEVKAHRSEIIMQQQYEIFAGKQESKVGKVMTAIVDGFDEENMLYMGRTYMDAPEIDSSVIISTEDELYEGQLVQLKIIGVDDCDLVGEVIGQDII
ncbi:MAG: 30S ribosomal protein S12 methylthiotransferase RimO [Clostridia bacterium]|nr:30S ribosomal protein S12 methylthiotransferase RimO [Clostridia bacterium]